MTNNESIKMLQTIKRTISLGNRKFVDAIDVAIKTLSTESKKGKWVEVHGYATPGGDPVWACSECGKGVHVYGIEYGTYGHDISDRQWVSCPNCGISMGGEDE